MYGTQTGSENSGVLHNKQNQTNTRKPRLKESVLSNMQPHPLQPDPPLGTKGGEFPQGLFV